VWCRIAAAWLVYHEKFLGDETLPDEEERKLLGALVAISSGVEDVSKVGVPAEVGWNTAWTMVPNPSCQSRNPV